MPEYILSELVVLWLCDDSSVSSGDHVVLLVVDVEISRDYQTRPTEKDNKPEIIKTYVELRDMNMSIHDNAFVDHFSLPRSISFQIMDLRHKRKVLMGILQT